MLCCVTASQRHSVTAKIASLLLVFSLALPSNLSFGKENLKKVEEKKELTHWQKYKRYYITGVCLAVATVIIVKGMQTYSGVMSVIKDIQNTPLDDNQQQSTLALLIAGEDQRKIADSWGKALFGATALVAADKKEVEKTVYFRTEDGSVGAVTAGYSEGIFSYTSRTESPDGRVFTNDGSGKPIELINASSGFKDNQESYKEFVEQLRRS